MMAVTCINDDESVYCSCPVDMHFDGNGDCACDYGGWYPDCDPPLPPDPRGGGDPLDRRLQQYPHKTEIRTPLS